MATAFVNRNACLMNPPCGAAVGRGTAAKRWWRGRDGCAKGPSVSAAPKAQFILSDCKAVEGRCHLPIAVRQGGSATAALHPKADIGFK